jgi:glucose-6-phosphate isomerase/transaldolase/glucose-6-phosphate isomerase
VAIEMGRGQGWHRWVGDGELVVLSRFGASGPGAEVAKYLGFSVDAVVARVRAAVAGRRPALLGTSVPPQLEGVTAGRRARLDALHAAPRLQTRDATLWGDCHAGEVARRLGWLDLPGRARIDRAGLERAVAQLDGEGARTLVLLGMGGSSLAPRVLRQVLGNPSGRELIVVDTTDPDFVGRALEALVPRETAFLAVSKSGKTAETTALTEIAWRRMTEALGDRAGRHFATVTEHGTPLERLAEERGFAVRIAHPVDVGGRFSALSAVGLLPSLWLGHDIDALVGGAERVLRDLSPTHPAFQLAILAASVAPEGWGRLAWCASRGLAPLGAWAEQLIAESTGKSGRGVLPVLLPAPPAGTPWPSTLYVSARFVDEDTEELDAALDRLAESGAPVARFALARPGLGEAFMTFEVATSVLGVLLGINPFDEPDVVRAKERARAALNAGAPSPEPFRGDLAAALQAHLKGIAPCDAVVLLAYLREDEATERALAALAVALASRFAAPVTWAFGPRYLHSTGQLHKGGPARVTPVVLTADPRTDLAIPHQPHTLGQLRLAQALGDVAALREVGRPVFHAHLSRDAAAVLDAVTRTLVR